MLLHKYTCYEVAGGAAGIVTRPDVGDSGWEKKKVVVVCNNFDIIFWWAQYIGLIIRSRV